MILGEKNVAYPIVGTHFKDRNTLREWSGLVSHHGNRVREIWYVNERLPQPGKGDVTALCGKIQQPAKSKT